MLGVTAVSDAMGDMMSGHGAIAAVVIGFEFFHPAGHRSDNFHGSIKELLFDSIGAVVAGAALDCFYLGIRHQLEDIAGFHAEILDPLMAGRMIGHFAQRSLKVGFELVFFMAQCEVFKRIEKGISNL